MKKLVLSLSIIILTLSCNSKQTSSETKLLKEELSEKEKQISDLQNQIKNLQEENEKIIEPQTSDYYRFIQTSDSKINVAQTLKSGEKILLDKKELNDTLDISDNFFVYKHTAEITQTTNSQFEFFIRDFDQVKSTYGSDFFVKVMTF